MKMKTEAVGNGAIQAHGGMMAGTHAVEGGDAFFNMLQTIFAARIQMSQAPQEQYHDPAAENMVAGDIKLDGDAPLDGEKQEALDQLLAFYLFAGQPAQNPGLADAEAAKVLAAAELQGAQGDQFLALLSQKWDEMPQSGREMVKMILAGLLGENAVVPAEGSFRDELPESVNAAASKDVFPGQESSQLLQEELSGKLERLVQVAAKLLASMQDDSALNGEHSLQRSVPNLKQLQERVAALISANAAESPGRGEQPAAGVVLSELSSVLKELQELLQAQHTQPGQHELSQTARPVLADVVGQLSPQQLEQLSPQQLEQLAAQLQERVAALISANAAESPGRGEQPAAGVVLSELSSVLKELQELLQAQHTQPGQHELSQTARPVLADVVGQLSPQQLEQLSPQQLEQLAAQLQERVAALARSPEELAVLEKQLAQATMPPVSEKGLSTQATALVASYLQEGKPLEELPASLLSKLAGQLTTMEIPKEGEADQTGEKGSRPFNELLNRVESFLKGLLSSGRGGGREGADAPVRQFSEQFTEQQLKNMQQAGDRDYQALAGDKEQATFSAAAEGRTENAGITRFVNPQPPVLHPNEVMPQVMERLALLARPGVQELRMQLHPEHLGNILIRLRNVKGVLSAEILTQNVAVKELLEGQLDALQKRFQEMNLQIDEFRVLVGDEEQGRGDQTGDSENTPGIRGGSTLQEDDTPLPAAEPLQWDGERHRLDYLA